jgi:hypothetical protein
MDPVEIKSVDPACLDLIWHRVAPRLSARFPVNQIRRDIILRESQFYTVCQGRRILAMFHSRLLEGGTLHVYVSIGDRPHHWLDKVIEFFQHYAPSTGCKELEIHTSRPGWVSLLKRFLRVGLPLGINYTPSGRRHHGTERVC